MAENSKIEWCDHTVNLWWGCSKVHTGCKNCYAEVLSDTRYQKNLWGEKGGRQRIKSAFNDLDKYQKQASAENKLLKIFCGSMMDIFEASKYLINPTEDIVDSRHDTHDIKYTGDLRNQLFQRITDGKYNNLIFLFLTKRPENIDKFIPLTWLANAPKNVWFGTSISDQITANLMVKTLVRTGQNNLFLSMEPQVSWISLKWTPDLVQVEMPDILDSRKKWPCYENFTKMKWIIQGGESGSNKRPFDINWAYSMKDDCESGHIQYFFKQIDKIQPVPNDLLIRQFPEFQSFDGKIKTEATWATRSTL